MVFSVDVFHGAISLRDQVGFLPFPPRVQCFLNLASPSSVLLSQRMLTVDPLTCHLTVSTSSSRVWMIVSADPWRLIIDFPFFFHLFFPEFCIVFELIMFLSPTFLTSSQSVASLSQTHPQLCHLHSCFPSRVLTFPTLAWTAAISYFSI